MSQDAYFLLRARSPRAVATILQEGTYTGWSLLDSSASLDELIEKAPTSQPGIVLSIPDYFPSDADELERYRRQLLAVIPLAELAKLHDDPRGIFIFDPMVVEEHGAESYDEIIAACAEYGGLWFDPARPATEQNLAFEERETIEVTADMIDEIMSTSRKKKVKKPAKKSGGTKKAAKKSAKKPVKKVTKKPVKKVTKKPAKKPKPSRTALRKKR